MRALRDVIDVLHTAGLSLALTPDRAVKVTPASKLTPALRDLIRESKPVLIDWLTAANDSVPDGTPPATVAKFHAASPAVDAEVAALHGDTTPHPDGWCWPHSDAMNGAEIDTMMRRFELFTRRGMSTADAEALADRLVLRDRKGDARQTCAECRQGHARRCADGAPLPADMFHHCTRFGQA